MSKIKVLPYEIIAKIAAGEIIERPVYAVKELLDNAIDAGATVININLIQGGLNKIEITDNGVGMTADELTQAVLPHATSKVSQLDDLNNIKTLGFRGEALWSISSVSQLNIKTRTSQQTEGSQISLSFGNLTKLSPVGTPFGTSVEILNIFSNVPARLKFLKSATFEFHLILDLVTRYTLSFPEIAFKLSNNSRLYFSLPEKQDLAQRIGVMIGSEIYENLLPINIQKDYLKITGFLTTPHSAITTQSKQYTFVNKRVISDKKISTLIKSVYGTLIEPKSFPVFFISLELPYERVDVNVHPRKEQVVFTDQKLILNVIEEAATETLSKQNLRYHDQRWKRGDYINNTPLDIGVRKGNTKSFSGLILKESTSLWNVYTNGVPSSEVVQIHNLYICYQTKSGMILVDQHAAHERILYEQYMQQFKSEKSEIKKIKLKSPQKINFSYSDQPLVEEALSKLNEIGFEIDYSENDYTLFAIPELFKDRNIPSLLREIIADYQENQEIKEMDNSTLKMIAYLACRTAIKAGDKLTQTQARNLIEQLNRSPNNVSCPHGRPTQKEITLNELRKFFHR